jgi:NhaP-type Na+/H+ or K+/H+ antiporter
MTAMGWFLAVGLILFATGVAQPLIRRLPVTNTMIYLAVGVVLGPTVLGVFHFNPLDQSRLLEIITEVAVLLSLFTAGTKMPVPVRAARWRVPIRLAWLGMALTALLMTAFGYFALGLPLGAAVLLGGILVPTDPVLASDIQVRQPGDPDRLRLFLTAEAGMNDGSAFPVVMLGLGLLGVHELGALGSHWLITDVLWATMGGLVVGTVAGSGAGYLVQLVRQRFGEGPLFDDFIGLGMVGIVYGTSLLLSVWGFLAVFCAAIALRQIERRLAEGATPTATMADRAQTESTDGFRPPSAVSHNSLDVHETLERLIEVTLILLLGGTLFWSSWSWHAVGTAAFLFLVARPVGVLLSSIGSRTPLRLRALISWFGVRGIGSLYYLMFVIQQGIAQAIALELLHITLVVVTLSILVHGISVKPMMERFHAREESIRGETP